MAKYHRGFCTERIRGGRPRALAGGSELGVAEVPVDVQEFATEADEWAHLMAENRIAELSNMDQNGMGDLLRDLGGVA